MKTLVAGVFVGTVWTVSPNLLLPAAIVALALLIVDSLMTADPGPVTVISRIPTTYERRRRGFGWSLGLGITRWGPFPFITIYRRRRL